jgi:hypothetical protein
MQKHISIHFFIHLYLLVNFVSDLEYVCIKQMDCITHIYYSLVNYFHNMFTFLMKYSFELFYRVAKETIKEKERGTKTNSP